MLKLRAMGTTNDLKWFKKITDRYDVFHVIRMSEPLPMKQKLPEMKEKVAEQAKANPVAETVKKKSQEIA